MSETIFIIDGMYLVFSSFYSNNNMRTLKGEPTGAVYGFITRTENMIKELKPTRVAVAFDVREKTFRHKMYPEYKAKRMAPPEELLAQLPFIKEYLEARGISIFESPGLEADDIIAHVSRDESAKGNKVIIFTADKDLFQLVTDENNVRIFHPKLKEELDCEGIKNQYGMSPRQIVDYLSLMGDSSDNIPGVPGVGEKTAKKLIDQFGTIDNMLENLGDIKEKLRAKIETNLELLKLSKQLIDLSDIPRPDKTFEPEPFKNEVNDDLIDLYERLSFGSLLKKLKGAKRVSKNERTSLDIEYVMVKNRDQLKELKEKILAEKYFAYDLETTALEFHKARIVGMSISFYKTGYYIPFIYPGADDDITVTFDDFKEEMTDVFEDEAIRKTGHNLKFDMLHLKPYGIEVKGVKDDSMVMSYLLHPNRRAHSLKDLTYEILNYRQVEYDQLVGKGKNQAPLITVDLEKLSRYCIDDSNVSLQLIKNMDRQIDTGDLRTLYDTIEMPLVKVLTDMEYAGVRVDVAFLEQATKQFKEKIREIEEEIFELAGCRFNLNSSQQLGELLFEKMQMPVKKRTKVTKSFSTDNEVLMELRSYPIVAKVIDYRSYNKILSTYLEGLMETVDKSGRVHTSYNQTVTATGRLSSSNPNLQNIPVGETGGVNVRDAFGASEGKRLLAADYSQVELRVMAHFSKDKNLVEAFANDFDIHQHTADKVFGKDLFLSARERRKRAKIINFSVLYGSGAFSLSKELGVSFKEAKSFIEMYFEKYVGVKDFMEDVIARAEEDPEVKTISGRRRKIPEITSSNRNVKENGNRMAINTTIQGSAADIIKIAMLNIHEKLKGLESTLIMQVHDELVFEYPPAEEEQLFKLVKSEMENAYKLEVPLKVVLKKGETWGTMTEVDM
ncbi:MAG: DNA polymerase I [bacterium]|nr:DNA polymerase I [bacterium]